MTARERLAAVLAPELVDAIEELVAERLAASVDVHRTSVRGFPWLSLLSTSECRGGRSSATWRADACAPSLSAGDVCSIATSWTPTFERQGRSSANRSTPPLPRQCRVLVANRSERGGQHARQAHPRDRLAWKARSGALRPRRQIPGWLLGRGHLANENARRNDAH